MGRTSVEKFELHQSVITLLKNIPRQSQVWTTGMIWTIDEITKICKNTAISLDWNVDQHAWIHVERSVNNMLNSTLHIDNIPTFIIFMTDGQLNCKPIKSYTCICTQQLDKVTLYGSDYFIVQFVSS